METSSNIIETTDSPIKMKLTDEENETGEGKERDVSVKESVPEDVLNREYPTSPDGVDEKEKEQSQRDNPSDSNDGDEYKKMEGEIVNEGDRMKRSDEQLKDSSFIITTSPSPDSLSSNLRVAVFPSSKDDKMYPE
jgi:hypothetical protein